MMDRYLVLKNTECSDGESTQRFLTYQVHCVLTKFICLATRWPVLVAALLLIISTIIVVVVVILLSLLFLLCCVVIISCYYYYI